MFPLKSPNVRAAPTHLGSALRAALFGTTALAVVGIGVAPVMAASELDDLKAMIEEQDQQLQELKRKLEQLEKRQQEAPPPDKIVTEGDVPGSFKVPGTNTSISMGGYVKADFIYDIDGFFGPSAYFSSLPFEDSELSDREGGFTFHGRQSRFNFKTHTPTEMEYMGKPVDISTHLEFDFLRNTGNEVLSNSFTPRLRHAYGKIGPVLIGQTWSAFMDVDAYPWTVDFFGPAGFSFVRQPQIRYTHDFGEGNTLAFSIENPELVASDPIGGQLSLGTGGIGGSDGVFDRTPDFVLQARAERDWGWVQLAGIVRDLAVDLEPGELGAGAAGGKDDEFGWGVHLSTVFDVPMVSNLKVGAIGIYGEGVGRYIITEGFNLGAAEIQSAGSEASVNALEQWAVSGWLQYNLTDDLWVGAAYGRSDTEAPGSLGFAALDTANDEINSLHANVFWNITDRATMGVEYIRGWAETPTGRDREGNRIQFGTWFWF